MVVKKLSWFTTQLDSETVKFILNRGTLGAVHWAQIHDPAMVECDQCLEQEVWVAAGCPLVEMHVTNWAKAQKEDPMMSTMLDWLKVQKQTDLKMLLVQHASSKEGKLVLQNQQNFTIHQGTLYLCLTPKGKAEDLPLFTKWVPPRCRTLRAWLDTVLVVRMLLVARNDWPGTEIPKVLFALLAAWRQFVKCALTANCVHHSDGSPAHRLY